MSAQLFPWLEMAPTTDQMADIPLPPRRQAKPPQKPAPKREGRRTAADKQRRKWTSARIV